MEITIEIRQKVASLAGVSLLAIAGISGTAFAEKPDKWVRYVEATGSQYVDTCITGRWNTKAECKVEWMNFSDSSFLAARSEVYPGNGRLYFCYSLDTNGVMYSAQDVGDKVSWYQGGETWICRFETNRVYTYTSEFTPTNGEGKAINNVRVDGIYSSGYLFSKERTGINAGYSLYIFANNQKGSAVSQSKTRCYGLKLWQGPVDGGDMTLVRDFYPCMKGGRAGLYDAVSETIFYSGSGTDLVCDENSEVPDEFIDYVESPGTDADYSAADYPQYPPYLDTGIIGRSGTKMSGEFAILKSEDNSILDSRKGDSRFYMLHSFNSKMTCGYGGHLDNTTPLTLTLGKKYWVETELNAGSQTQKIGADGVTNTVLSGTSSTAIDTDYPLYLFACNKDGKPIWFPKARCYGFKLWQGNANGSNMQLVRNYRPCLKNGVAGLYDDVTKRIYYSSGIPFTYETRKAVKPKEVIFVDYIESDGNNTLDTYVPARSGTRAKGEMAWTQAGDYGDGKLRSWNHEMYRYLEYTGSPNVFYRQQRSYLASATKNDLRFWMLHEYDKQISLAHGSKFQAFAYTNGVELLPDAGVKNSFDVTLNNGSQTMKWNDETVVSTNITGDINTGDTLHLFSSSFWRFRSVARCYGLQIWQDGNLVRDFKPCIYENRGMLYDMVTEKLYRPSPDIPVSRTGPIVFTGYEKPSNHVEYVESDRSVFVDTGVIGKSGTAADMEVAILESNDKAILDARNVNLRYYQFHNASGRAMVGYDGWYYVPETPGGLNTNSSYGFPMTIGQKYHVESLLADGTQTVKIDGIQQLTDTKAGSVDTGLSLYLFSCHYNNGSGVTPYWHGKGRIYWLKLYQGDVYGNNLQLVRDFKPVRLANGLVVLWDFVENKPYPAQSTNAPYNNTTFSAVGPDGDRFYTGARIIVR